MYKVIKAERSGDFFKRLSVWALAIFLVCGAAILYIGFFRSTEQIYTSTLFAMDTVMELQIYGKNDLTADAENFIRSIENELSVTDTDSQVGRLNIHGEELFTGEVADIIKGAYDVCQRTDGALDITIYPVLKAWGFTTGNYRVPSDSEIEELLKKVDYNKVSIEDMGDKTKVSLSEGTMVDLGSVVKGYTGTAIAERLKGYGVKHALINLGGNVQCLGTKPGGEKWKVGIKSPFKDSSFGAVGVFSAADVSIVTSGGYERFFEEDGSTYWHILDPEDGKPAHSGLASVTVIGKDGLLCDGLSTALFVKGLDEGISFWRQSDDFEAIFITEDREVYVTEGISGDFSLTGEYHDLPLHVVLR